MSDEHRAILKEVEYCTAQFVKAAKCGDTREMNVILFELRELQQQMMFMEIKAAYPDAFSDDQPSLFGGDDE